MIIIYEILAFSAVGMLAGFLAGLLGVGGGIIIVPALYFLFKSFHIGTASSMHLVIGTTLASMIITTSSSSLAQFKKHNINFSIVKAMGVGSFFGALIGVYTANFLPSLFLKVFFGILECLLGIRFITSKKTSKNQGAESKRPSPPLSILAFFSVCISFLSTILGLSGGVMIAPLLHYFHFPLKKAIGTSSALSFLITLIGSIAFAFVNKMQLNVSDTIGLIYLPAFLSISAVAVFAAPFGVRLSHILPTSVLKKIFGFVLLMLGLSMLIIN